MKVVRLAAMKAAVKKQRQRWRL